MPKFSLTGRLAELHTLNLISPKAAYDNWLSRMKTCNLFSLGFKEQIRCSGRFFFSKCTTCFKPNRIWFCDVLRNLPPVTRATSLFSSFEYRQKKKEKKTNLSPASGPSVQSALRRALCLASDWRTDPSIIWCAAYLKWHLSRADV